jgi:hypothetical protein
MEAEMPKVFFAVLVVVGTAFGGAYDILVVYCEGGGGYTIPEFDDNYYYDSVTYMDGTYSLISQATCADYGCVFSWNNYSYQSGQGDAFGNYVTDDDGAVVLCIWGISQCYGKIVDDPTLCPINGGGSQYSSVNLGTIYEPYYPIMDDVSSITGMYYWVSGNMESGALRVADNSAGTPLAAINEDEDVAALNICPGSYKSWSGDGWILMNNTIEMMLMSGPVDNDPPYVYGVDPEDGEVDVPVDSNIVFHCKDDHHHVELFTIDFTARDTTLSGGRALHTGASMGVVCDSNNIIPGDLDFDDTDPKDVVCTFDPTDDLNDEDTITCTVAAGLADSYGNVMVDDFVWSFETVYVGVVQKTWGAIKAEF